MKQVAGSLRLDLAQYRELEAFAQFGSDLDKSTQAQLNRGMRMVELLKQPQYKPMGAEHEVLSLFAGARGFLDKHPVSSVQDYEKQMLEYVDSKYPEIVTELKDKKAIDSTLEEKMKQALTEFQTVFQPSDV
jgi:F-type H+/Na+-transporting ATPase subunit alpha